MAIQILTIVGYSWIGTAGKLGAAHWMFWLPAVLLFFVPSGIVVAHLAKEMPLEGGMYQWARLRFGPMAGFLVAMNIWLFSVLMVSSLGLQMVSTLPYWIGQEWVWITTDKRVLLGVSLGLMLILMLVAWRGLAVGKWINNFGGYGQIVVYVMVLAVAVPYWLAGDWGLRDEAFAVPAFSLLNLNLLGKMGFGALCGVDGVAVFSGECRSKDVGAAIRRSTWLTAPVIGVMMVLGTASVLTFVKPEGIDLVMPPVQVVSVAMPALAQFLSVLIVMILVAGGCLMFSMLTRFPMVAGWDHLLPEWFSRLDPRYQTPVWSVVFAGAVSLVFAVAAIVGAGNQEAFQLMFSAALVSYACAYLVMFAIPLVAKGEKPSWGVRLAALSGFAMTLLFVVLSVFPIVEEQNPGLFTLKMVGLVGGLQLAGVLFYRRQVRE